MEIHLACTVWIHLLIKSSPFGFSHTGNNLVNLWGAGHLGLKSDEKPLELHTWKDYNLSVTRQQYALSSSKWESWVQDFLRLESDVISLLIIHGKVNIMDRATYDHYWKKGWVIVEGVFKADDVKKIAKLATDIAQQDLSGITSPLLVDRSADGRSAPRKLKQPFLRHEAFRSFVLDDRLVSLMAGLLKKTPLPVTDQVFMKPPGFGSAKPYHQDNAYFHCFPADEVITAWIALDDVDEENGCLRYIDGSHKGPLLPHEPLPDEPNNYAPPEELIDLAKESLAPVGQGGVIFHHSLTLHTSHRNQSERWRRGYGSHWVTADVVCEKKDESKDWMAFTSLESAYFHNDLYPQPDGI